MSSSQAQYEQQKALHEFRERLAQVGILIGTLGLILALIGLFPSITGVEAQTGIGVLQILIVLLGLSLLVIGALIFVKATFYPATPRNLAQDIAVRLTLTGILMTSAAGLSDVLGFGSHTPGNEENLPYLGPWQALGMVIGFAVASAGVMIFAVMGPPEPTKMDENH